MKRCYLGAALLLVLLVIAIGATWIMSKSHAQIEEDLNQAAQCVMQGDWVTANHHFFRAKAAWDRDNRMRACLADHTPVEEIDAQFALLEVYCLAREDAAFAGGCRELARKAAAVGEAHEFVWWNIF